MGSVCSGCVCVSHVDHILVALQHGVECVQVTLSVSAGFLQHLDLFLQALLSVGRLRPQSLQSALNNQGQVQVSKQGLHLR